MKIAVIGAGAVGSFIIWGFYNCPEIELLVIAEGERKKRLEQGLFINGENFRPAVMTAAEAGEVDLIIIATKYSGLDEAINYLPELLKEDTIVLSLLNGVDSEEKIAKKIGWNHVRRSVIRIASRRDERGVSFDPSVTRCLYFGNGDLPDSIYEAFDRSRLEYNLDDDIKQDEWIKYASNMANNLPQAVVNMGNYLYSSEHGYFIAKKIWNEVRAVGLAKKVDIGEKPFMFTYCKPEARFSTLQDLDAGRTTEIEMFAGNLMKMAREENIEVPYTEYTYHAIKAIEEKNAGIIG